MKSEFVYVKRFMRRFIFFLNFNITLISRCCEFFQPYKQPDPITPWAMPPHQMSTTERDPAEWNQFSSIKHKIDSTPPTYCSSLSPSLQHPTPSYTGNNNEHPGKGQHGDDDKPVCATVWTVKGAVEGVKWVHINILFPSRPRRAFSTEKSAFQVWRLWYKKEHCFF